ncbi:MAG: GNAT family N-acetyltransferase [Cellulomonas sp.]
MSARIRHLTDDDAAAVLAIYAEGIATGTATFETAAPPWESWDASHLAEHRFVAADDAAADGDVVLGWVAASPVSGRCVYAGVIEVSVYVAAAGRGRGLGGALVEALVESSEAAGVWTLEAGVFSDNAPSLALLDRHGFRRVGVRERLAQRDGLWRDVVLLERRSSVV